MNIALIGYGKMGKEIERIAVERGHNISEIIDINQNSIQNISNNIDVAIEFTNPASAKNNVYDCLGKGIAVVSGTTGWNLNIEDISKKCIQNNTAMFYASNFSVGMNIFMTINEKLAKLLNDFKDYSAKIEETHHIHKLDKPSGTAITLAKDIIDNSSKYQNWELNKSNDILNLCISSFREGEVIGDHKITWENEIDNITISHSAKNRSGFAIGAVLAAEFIQKKTGFFTMKNLLNL